MSFNDLVIKTLYSIGNSNYYYTAYTYDVINELMKELIKTERNPSFNNIYEKRKIYHYRNRTEGYGKKKLKEHGLYHKPYQIRRDLD